MFQKKEPSDKIVEYVNARTLTADLEDSQIERLEEIRKQLLGQRKL